MVAICQKCKSIITGKSITCPNCNRIFDLNIECLEGRVVKLNRDSGSELYYRKSEYQKCFKCSNNPIPGERYWQYSVEIRFCPACGSFLYILCQDCERIGHPDKGSVRI